MKKNHVPSNPDVAPHLKRIIIIIIIIITSIIITSIIIIIIFLVLHREWGEWSKGSNPYPQLIFIKGSKFATPSDLYVDDNKNMNLSCWGIKIRHPLWLLRWQGSLHHIFLKDQQLAPPLTYMWCNIWYMCYVLVYTSATSDSDAEQRRGCSEHV